MSYSRLQVWLHWTIAALVIFQLVVHDGMSDARNAREDGDPLGNNAVWAYLHISVGVSVLLLSIVRVWAWLTRGAPPVHRDKPAPLVWIAYATHALLYGFIFFMPLAGAIAWFGLQDWSADVHEAGRTILIPLILLHGAGALGEHFIFRNDTLVRMLKSRSG